LSQRDRSRVAQDWFRLLHFRQSLDALNLEDCLVTHPIRTVVLAAALAFALTACGSPPTPPPVDAQVGSDYLIGPGDAVNVFVWRNPELSMSVPVRPDGKISTPLVEDVPAVGKTPTLLARDLEERLKKFVRDPIVTVIVTNFVGDYVQQVRVIGEAQEPRALSYRANMSLLDVMIQVGGLTKYAAGNRAILIRTVNGEQSNYPVKLDSLIKYGDVRYNFAMQPGDTLIIPQSIF
jgi:polysaccharide export outer membrane protein